MRTRGSLVVVLYKRVAWHPGAATYIDCRVGTYARHRFCDLHQDVARVVGLAP